MKILVHVHCSGVLLYEVVGSIQFQHVLVIGGAGNNRRVCGFRRRVCCGGVRVER